MDHNDSVVNTHYTNYIVIMNQKESHYELN